MSELSLLCKPEDLLINPTEVVGSHLIRSPREGDGLAFMPTLELLARDLETGEPDYDDIHEIVNAVEFSTQALISRQYAVAENSDGQVVGLMGLKPLDRRMRLYALTKKPVEVINAFVHPNEQGHGVGRALLARIEDMAIERGYEEIVLNSGPRYEKSGGWEFWQHTIGEPVYIAHGYYGDGRNAPVWRKLLAKSGSDAQA